MLKRSMSRGVLFPLTFSPDARALALIYDSSNGIPILNIKRLPDGKMMLPPLPAYNGSATWSSNGTQIAYSDIWCHPIIIDLSSKKKETVPGRGSPIWSPNGKFISVDETLRLVNKKRTIKLRLPDRASVVGWTPDSRSLLYTQEDSFKRYPLYEYDIASKQITRVMPNYGGSDNYPTIWRP